MVRNLVGHEGNVNALEFLISSGVLLSVSADSSFAFWNYTNGSVISQMSIKFPSGNYYHGNIPCVKELTPNVVALGDVNWRGSNVIYFMNVSNMESPFFATHRYISSTCTDMKLFDSNRLVVASNQMSVDMWSLDSSFDQSTLDLDSEDNSTVLCVEDLGQHDDLNKGNQSIYT
jgi:WD40 repeat protein